MFELLAYTGYTSTCPTPRMRSQLLNAAESASLCVCKQRPFSFFSRWHLDFPQNKTKLRIFRIFRCRIKQLRLCLWIEGDTDETSEQSVHSCEVKSHVSPLT